MPWIQNISLADARSADHYDPSGNSILIQIVDPGMEFPNPGYKYFKHIHQFNFLDIETDGVTQFDDGKLVDMAEFAITQEQAAELVKILKQALANDSNVVVHCVAGVCRSGAVCEVGVMLGFRDTGSYRQPNMLVKHKMMKELGWTYSNE